MVRLVCLIFFSILSVFFQPNTYAQSIKELYEKAAESYNSGQYEASMEFYKQIIQQAPNFAPAYNGLGMALKESGGDTDEVINYYKMAIHYDPNYTQAYNNLGRFYYGDQDYDHAQEYFEKALKIDPNMSEAKLNLAWIYLMARSKPGKAVLYFKQVASNNPTPNVYFGLGLAYFADNQREDALDMITKLRNMGSEDYASRLENTVRQNHWVNLQEAPTKITPAAGKSPAPQATANPTSDATGVKVRLRGKLSDTQ